MIIDKEFRIANMHCASCEKIIEDAISQIDGIENIKADYSDGMIKVSYDESKINLEKIHEACISKGYLIISEKDVKKDKIKKIILSISALAGIIMIIILMRIYGGKVSLPEINSQTGIGLIFIFGLITGLHCVGMCGSFIIGYTSKDTLINRSSYKSHFLYSLGKTLTYTLLGAIFGFFGSLIKITPLIGGISITIAGAFLIIYGLNILNVFNFIKVKIFKRSSKFTDNNKRDIKKSKSPFFIGIFAGFILGCGPLQAMYILAAGVGDVFIGAKLLFFFGLGTLPALIGFGFLSKLLSSKMNHRFLQVSGIILVIMGLMMLNKGFMKMGTNNEVKSVQTKSCCEKKMD